jgi:hypothetical protein
MFAVVPLVVVPPSGSPHTTPTKSHPTGSVPSVTAYTPGVTSSVTEPLPLLVVILGEAITVAPLATVYENVPSPPCVVLLITIRPFTRAHAENSDVLPALSVAVAVTTLFKGRLTAKVAMKLPGPLTDIAPRNVSPSPCPDGSQEELEKNSIVMG